MGKLSLVNIIAAILIFGVGELAAQTIYLNSYVERDGIVDNYVFEIDIDQKQKLDSLQLYAKGEFISKAPFYRSQRGQGLLISSLVNGLAAKNSVIREHTYSYYYFINSSNLNLIREDSMVDKMIETIVWGQPDTITVNWYDEISRQSMRSYYRIDPDDHSLRYIRSRVLSNDDFRSEQLGSYVGPDFICQLGSSKYYWGLEFIGESSFVNVFKVNSDTVIVGEARVGDRRVQNIICGYNPQAEKIYCFLTPYELLSFSPVSESPQNVRPRVLIIDPQNLSIETEIEFQMGDAYAAQEVGTAESAGPYLYYYYFQQDGYGQFDPAYLLIFDTRTNEASWLRVGWR